GPTADMSVSVSGDADPIVAGGTLTYTVAARNLGPMRAQQVAVLVVLPPGMRFRSAVPSVGTVRTPRVGEPGPVLWRIGSRVGGGEATLAREARGLTRAGRAPSASALITSNSADPEPSNDAA